MPSNFKVLAGASGEPIDPNFRNVTLLLHGDGNNGGQNNAFVDSSSNHFPISRNGNTTQGSFSPYGSNWSIYSDGTGDCITVPANAAFAFGTGDFTIEFWMYLPSWTDEAQIIGAHTAFSGLDFLLQQWNSGEFRYLDGALTLQSGYAPPTNQWNHVAVTRSGTTVRIFVNGVQRASGTSTANIASNRAVGMLGDTSGAQSQIGYMSNVRIVKGTALYTTNFTPSTSPLTAVSGTSLLTCAYNRFRDGSTNNFTVTRFGNVKVTNFAPFAPSSAAAYDQSDVQYWSGSFNGGTDRVQVPVTSNMYLGTTYTIEAWAYYSGTSYGARPIFSQCESFQGGFAGLTLTLNASGNLVAEYRPATSGAVTVITGPTVTPNTWFHIALVSDNSSAKLFVNGQQVGSTTTFGDYPSAKTTFVAVGSWGHGWNDGGIPAAAWIGYISNMRVVKGVAVYSANFTPPTSPLTAVSGTVLLTCQNASFTDNSSVKNILTPVSNATVVGNSPYNPVGYWSNSFDGTGDYLTATSNAAFGVGTGDFTVEAWIYPTGAWTSGGYNCLLQIDGTGIYFGQNNAGFGLRQSGTANIISYGTSPTLNTWTHVAIVRSGTTVTMYYNGTSVATATSSANFSAGNAWVGADAGPGSYYAGYISNLRIVKGAAVYTANFTVPTTPLTAISGTSLLTCQANRFIDSSTNAFTITRNGDVAVRDFDPFTGASVTSTGGSAYFDGSGDYLSVARNTAFIPTTGDFTIEAWVYPTTSGTTRFIMGLLEQGTAGDWSIFLHTNDTLGFFAGGADSFGGTVTPYQWNHVAISRSGSTIYKCVNGTATTATFTNSLDSSTGYNLTIGADNAGDEILFYGWMTDARVVKGTAIYTSTTYTVPTAPLTAVTNTGLLAKFQNAAIFDNSMKNNFETVGNAQISTSVKKFGTGSMYFDGSGDYLRAANNDIFAFGTGDFTVEMWAYFADNTATNRPLLDTGVNSNTGRLLIRQGNDAGTSNVVNAFVSGTTVGSPTISFNQWTHVAVVRQSGTVKIYINGTGGTGVSAAADLTQNGCLIGAFYDQLAWNFTGYIDDLRITKGVARYTANFTAPSAPFPNK